MALFNTTTAEEFEEKVVKSKKIVLVDFWATWCPPCIAMAPILHKLGDELDDIADVIKVDIEASDDNQNLAARHDVTGIPNMNIYKNGRVAETVVGMVPKAELESKLKALAS